MSRRADAFDAALGSPAATDMDSQVADLVDLVGALRAVPAPAPARPAFIADLRAELVAAAAVALAPTPSADLAPARPSLAPPLAGSRSRRERRLSVAIAGLALVGAAGSMAVAAGSALPGDVLYPVKRILENADTSLSARDRQGPELLQHATSRLVELDELNRRGGGPAQVVVETTMRDTLTTFTNQAEQASDLLLAQYAETGDESAVRLLKDFTGAGVASLVDLQATLPEAVEPAILDAAQVLVTIDQQAAQACPGCAGLGITDLPPTLVSAVIAAPEATTEPQAEAGTDTAVRPDGARVGPSRPGDSRAPGPDGSTPPTSGPTVAPTAPDAPTAPTAPVRGGGVAGGVAGATGGGHGGTGIGGAAPTKAPAGAPVPTPLPSVGLPVAPPVVDDLVDDVTGGVLEPVTDPLLGP